MTAPLLQVTNLRRSFGAVRALNGVTISVNPGELVGIIGPNGSGKTTLFNCITGRLQPDDGQILFRGSIITGRPMAESARRGLLRTFQEARFFASATTRENVEMAWVLGARYANDRENAWSSAGDILDLMRLTEIADVPARVLPFGRQRRLGVAMCLALRPLLLLLDEPAAGLNAAESDELAGCLRAIRGAGVTLGVVDHDMDFLLPMVERVVVLAEGRDIAAGPPAKVTEDPRVVEVYLGHRRESADGPGEKHE